MKELLIYVMIIAGLNYAAVAAGNESCPDIQKLRQSIHEQPYISLQLTQTIKSPLFETADTIQGRLWAGQNGKFRLAMPDQMMVSDGILYWSYSVENKQVLLDSIAKMGDWDPLTLLYDPEKIYRCVSEEMSRSGIAYYMEARDSLTDPQFLRLQVSGEGYVPKSLLYEDDNGSSINIYFEDFRRISSLPDSLFIFSPPPGVEVIQMP